MARLTVRRTGTTSVRSESRAIRLVRTAELPTVRCRSASIPMLRQSTRTIRGYRRWDPRADDAQCLLAAPAARRLKFEIHPKPLEQSTLREFTDDADSGDPTTPGDDPRIQQWPVARDGDQPYHARQLARDGPDQTAQRQNRHPDREPLPF